MALAMHRSIIRSTWILGKSDSANSNLRWSLEHIHSGTIFLVETTKHMLPW